MVLSLILIYQLLRKILGGSWLFESLTLALLIANVGYSFFLGNNISEQKGWSQQFEKRFEAFERRCEGVEKKVDGVEAELRKLHQHHKK